MKKYLIASLATSALMASSVAFATNNNNDLDDVQLTANAAVTVIAPGAVVNIPSIGTFLPVAARGEGLVHFQVRNEIPERVGEDVVGAARGEQKGNAFRWGYTLLLPVDGKTYEVQFDDWMYLMDNRVMLNKAEMSKFGIRLGEVTLSFVKRAP